MAAEKHQKHDKQWYLKTIDEVFCETKTSKHGLTDEDAAKRLQKEGLNVISSYEGESLIKKFLSEFNNMLIYILSVSAAISIVSGHHLEFWVIIGIILFTVVVGFIQEQRADRAIKALHKLTPKKVFVIRNSKKLQIDLENLVIGDIVVLERGMIVPADLRIIEGHELKINESILTGESNLKYKHANKLDKENVEVPERENMAFCGTSISSGVGKGIVVEKGLDSQLGIISVSIKSIKNLKSPLQKKIDLLSKRIASIVIIAAVILCIALIVQKTEFSELAIIIGAVLVSGIPESLPLVLTLSLTNGVKNMAKKNAIIKDISSVETLGTTTVICTDKTGTLTQNKMVVQMIVIGLEKEYNAFGKGYEPSFEFKYNDKEIKPKTLAAHKDFFKGFILCNNSDIMKKEGEWVVEGEPTEGALLTLAKGLGYKEDELRENNPRRFELPFDSETKFMAVVNKTGNTHTIYLKGAMEKVISKCSHIRIGNSIVKFTKKHKEKITSITDGYSSYGLRCLAFATKISKNPFEKNNKIKDKKIFNGGYIYEGLVGIEDPLREDAAEAVKTCKEAGIRVVMITGDYKITAQNIGKRLGLLDNEESIVITGHELDQIDDSKLDKIIDKVSIFARTSPEHKLRIVSSLQRTGEIVAMTGDGVNDAPALKKADIGIAMGLSGTDVARESSNMILTDDNFKSIASAVKEGRTIYSNIRRFVYYLLTGNFTEVLVILVTVLLGLLSPLSAIMILFINLVTSSFPAMALGIEPTHDGIMKQKPRNPKERILSNYILMKIIMLIPLLLFGTLALYLWELQYMDGNIDKARTLVFASIILFELFHVFNVRSLHDTIFKKGFFNNKYVFISVGGSLLLMMLSIYSTAGQAIFKTVPLSAIEWIVLAFVSSLIIFVTEMIKYLIKLEITEQERLGKIKNTVSN